MKTGPALVLIALALLTACRKVDHEAIARAKADLVGAWLRVSESGERPVAGFDLRADGSVGLLGNDALWGIAWNRVRDELVISTSGEHDRQPRSSRLEIASLENDTLELRGEDSDPFVGRYRRSPVEHVSGVVTYLEPVALPADARIEVRLAREGAPVAGTLVAPRAAVPFPFTLSVLPAPSGAATAATLDASVRAGGKLLFATPAPVPVEPGASDVELLLHRSPPPG